MFIRVLMYLYYFTSNISSYMFLYNISYRIKTVM